MIVGGGITSASVFYLYLGDTIEENLANLRREGVIEDKKQAREPTFYRWLKLIYKPGKEKQKDRVQRHFSQLFCGEEVD